LKKDIYHVNVLSKGEEEEEAMLALVGRNDGKNQHRQVAANDPRSLCNIKSN
jgi:hypothetical protein